MRSLASELGVPVMTIYNYIVSKEVLNELVVDHVLRSVEVPPPDAGAWDVRMRELQRYARIAMRRHPGLSFSRHGSSSREARRLAGWGHVDTAQRRVRSGQGREGFRHVVHFHARADRARRAGGTQPVVRAKPRSMA